MNQNGDFDSDDSSNIVEEFLSAVEMDDTEAVEDAGLSSRAEAAVLNAVKEEISRWFAWTVALIFQFSKRFTEMPIRFDKSKVETLALRMHKEC